MVPTTYRKASAMLQAIDERQKLETLSREEKAASRTLTSLRDKYEQLQSQKEKLTGEAETQGANKAEVRRLLHLSFLQTSYIFSSLA
jgi:structural maintenance of chromosome 1